MTGNNRINIRRKRKQRARLLFYILAFCILVSMACVLIKVTAAVLRPAGIQLKPVDISVLQGEEMPQLKLDITAEGKKKTVLDADSGYTVADLIKDFEKGNGYTMTCEADTSVEGSYPIRVKLDDSIAENLNGKWDGLVIVTVGEGNFEVKNAVGQWDGEKFKRYDGSYVTEEFVVSKGRTYYFTDEGKAATGWQDVNGGKYYFDKNGILLTGWQELDDAYYFLGTDGRMVTGWMKIGEAVYYFGDDGKMVTGEVKIGSADCVFDESGALKSRKGSIVEKDKPMVALTFDDGPGDRTMELLNVLETYHAHATFFMLGKKVPSYTDTVKKMKDIGCELGNHSYDHANLTKLDVQGIQSEVNQTNENIKAIVGQGATVMRPPYGSVNDTVKASVGMPMIFWSLDTLDWKTKNAQSTIDMVMNNVKDGDVILMHDIHTQSIDAALQLIPLLHAKGYQMVTVSEMAEAKEVFLENGGKYSEF